MAKSGSPITPEQAKAMAEEASREGYVYLFSVVIAAYNTEEYLARTLESVIRQTIGFDDVQVIIVDDGSTDGTFAICQEYAERYPHNVVAVHQENKGVSAARNAGLALAGGKYVNFLDSDDKWSSNAFSCALAFFEEHPDVRMVASRYVYFGARKGNHRLNYKFERTRVISLLAEHDCPQLSSSTCFFRADVLEGRSFCEELSVSEDTRLVNEILIDELRYGVMSGPTYRYRQRENADSAINTMKQNRSWYLKNPEFCYRHLMSLCEQKRARVLPFIQYAVMYDLQWRLRAKPPVDLSHEELNNYKQEIVSLLKGIDDSIIAEQRTISVDYVAYAFALKYEVSMRDVVKAISIKDGWLISRIIDCEGDLREVRIRPLDSLSDSLTIERIDINDNTLVIEGFLTSFRFKPDDVTLKVVANNRLVQSKVFESNSHKLVNSFSDDTPGKTAFTCEVPFVPAGEVAISASLSLLSCATRELRFRFDDALRLLEVNDEGDFALIKGCIVRLIKSNKISVRMVFPPNNSSLCDGGDEMTHYLASNRIEEYQSLAVGIPPKKRGKGEWIFNLS